MQILVSDLLTRLPGVDHGFGTRRAPLSQDGMASLEQVHSTVVRVAEGAGGCVGEGDALITNQPGLAVSVRSADCFPILLADARRPAVAAVHAGWRGTAGAIGTEVVRAMSARFGTSPRDIYAAIGPGIGVCCYEVGAEVARKFGLDGSGRIDLAESLRRQLVTAGVREERIDVLRVCTRCDAERFHSYRRDKLQAGRMISYIRMV